MCDHANIIVDQVHARLKIPRAFKFNYILIHCGDSDFKNYKFLTEGVCITY